MAKEHINTCSKDVLLLQGFGISSGKHMRWVVLGGLHYQIELYTWVDHDLPVLVIFPGIYAFMLGLGVYGSSKISKSHIICDIKVLIWAWVLNSVVGENQARG